MTQARLISSLAIVVAAIATITVVSVIGGGGSASGDTSGPNASGYFWTDSNAPAPTTSFAWMDATGGTDLPDVSTRDDNWETVDLPFPFNFFGTDYTQVDVSTNGFLSFDIDSDCNANFNWGGLDFGEPGHPIPHGEAFCENQAEGWGGNPLIALWFDDLDPGECGTVVHKTFGAPPDRMFVVEYFDVCHNSCAYSVCDPGKGITIEVILYEGSNDIKMQYMDTFFGTGAPEITEMNNGHSATIGLDKDATTGLQYSYHETIDDGLAVLYSTTEPAGLPTDTPSPTPVPTSTATPTPTPVATETATPTPAPTGEPVLAQGDNDCDGDTDAVDALAGLRHVAALDVNQQAGCPALGGAVPAGDSPDVFGDVDCDGDVDAVDGLKVLRFVAALSVTQNEPCTDIGQAF